MRMPHLATQSNDAALMYAGPLSQRTVLGFPCHSIIRSSNLIMRSDGSEKSTSMPKPSAKIIDDVDQADAASVGKLATHEVHRPALIDRSWHSQWHWLSRTGRWRASIRRFSSSSQ